MYRLRPSKVIKQILVQSATYNYLNFCRSYNEKLNDCYKWPRPCFLLPPEQQIAPGTCIIAPAWTMRNRWWPENVGFAWKTANQPEWYLNCYLPTVYAVFIRSDWYLPYYVYAYTTYLLYEELQQLDALTQALLLAILNCCDILLFKYDIINSHLVAERLK